MTQRWQSHYSCDALDAIPSTVPAAVPTGCGSARIPARMSASAPGAASWP